eukprot:GHVQ01004929.1.p1 GENE.GHVQ01004929.1~~GHVQ01004929.1.p1  ORF type:complete len:902 (-),score=115.41 GHVQ01004929.1:644-3349(-)
MDSTTTELKEPLSPNYAHFRSGLLNESLPSSSSLCSSELALFAVDDDASKDPQSQRELISSLRHHNQYLIKTHELGKHIFVEETENLRNYSSLLQEQNQKLRFEAMSASRALLDQTVPISGGKDEAERSKSSLWDTGDNDVRQAEADRIRKLEDDLYFTKDKYRQLWAHNEALTSKLTQLQRTKKQQSSTTSTLLRIHKSSKTCTSYPVVPPPIDPSDSNDWGTILQGAYELTATYKDEAEILSQQNKNLQDKVSDLQRALSVKEQAASTDNVETSTNQASIICGTSDRRQQQKVLYHIIRDCLETWSRWKRCPGRMIRSRNAAARRFLKGFFKGSNRLKSPDSRLKLWQELEKTFGEEHLVHEFQRQTHRLKLTNVRAARRLCMYKRRLVQVSKLATHEQERQSNLASIKELALRSEMDKISSELASAQSQIEHKSGAAVSLATIHEFFVEQIQLLHAQILQGRAGLRQIRDIEQSQTCPHEAQKLCKEAAVDCLRAQLAEQEAHLSQINTGVMNVEKDMRILDRRNAKEAIAATADISVTETPKPRVPYLCTFAAPEAADQDVQTDEAGIASRRCLYSGEQYLNDSTVLVDVCVTLIDEQDLIIRANLEELEWPLFLYAPLDSVKLKSRDPANIHSQSGLQSRSRMVECEEAVPVVITPRQITEKLGTEISELVDLEYFNGIPHLVLRGQENETISSKALDPLPRATLELECLYNDKQLFTCPLDSLIGPDFDDPIARSWTGVMVQCSTVRYGMVFYHLGVSNSLLEFTRYVCISAHDLRDQLGGSSAPDLAAFIKQLREQGVSGVNQDLLRRLMGLFHEIFKDEVAKDPEIIDLVASLQKQKATENDANQEMHENQGGDLQDEQQLVKDNEPEEPSIEVRWREQTTRHNSIVCQEQHI